MGLSSRTVLIPLAQGNGQAGRVARVQADETSATAHAANLDPRISALQDWGLYGAGAIALGAIRRLSLKRRGLALAQWIHKGPVASHVVVTNGPDIAGLAPENSRSAELGLALALLMHAGQSRERLAIATGALARDLGPGATGDDVTIDPVGGLGSKIEALIKALDAQKGAALAGRLLFFIPARTLDGDETVKAKAAELARLKAAYDERGVTLEIVPVTGLRACLERLEIASLETTWADRRLALCAAAALVAGVAAMLGQVWITSPVRLSFDDIAVMGGAKAMSPVRALYEIGAKGFRLQQPCVGAQGLAIFATGDSLIFRARIVDNRWPALDRWHFALVTVSEQSGIKVYPPETLSAPEASNGDVGATLPIGPPQEKNKLIILARRLLPIDAASLRSALEARIAEIPPEQRINAVVAYLADRYPGYIDYSFLSTTENVPCQPE